MISTTSMRRRVLMYPQTNSRRTGFTLIELLVATTVFIIGFTSAFGLFLAAMRFRTLTDDTVKLSLAASSIVAELGIGTPGTLTAPKALGVYLGSGNLPIAARGINPTTFYSFPAVPGSWYTVEKCTDVTGPPLAANLPDPFSPTLHLDLVVVMYPQGDPTRSLDIGDLNRRLKLLPGVTTVPLIPPQSTDALNELVKRGLATRVSAVVVRRPHWM